LRRQDVLAQTRQIAAPGGESRRDQAGKALRERRVPKRWPHRAKNGEGDEVEMAEKYRRRFPAHTDDRAACVAASYLMLRDLWNEAAAGAGVEAESRRGRLPRSIC